MQAVGKFSWVNSMKMMSRVVVRFFLVPFAFITAVAMRVLSPVLVVRVSPIASDRIGHLVVNGLLYGLGAKPKGRHFYIDIVFHSNWYIANHVVVNKLQSYLKIQPHNFWSLVNKFSLAMPAASKYEVPEMHHSPDFENLLRGLKPFRFSSGESERARQELREIGLDTNDPFIVLNIRDSAYLNFYRKEESENDWEGERYSHRNADVDTYIDAALALVDEGFAVVRVGAKVNKKIGILNSNVIDYATSGIRSEFLDVFLGANCAMCITTGTGFDEIPSVSGRPILFTDYSPLGFTKHFLTDSLMLPKNVLSIDSGMYLTQSEIWTKGIARLPADKLAELGLMYELNHGEDITAVALEMLCEIREGRNMNRSAEQNEFWEIYSRHFRRYPDWASGNLNLRIGAAYLKKYEHWIH